MVELKVVVDEKPDGNPALLKAIIIKDMVVVGSGSFPVYASPEDIYRGLVNIGDQMRDKGRVTRAGNLYMAAAKRVPGL